jgi:hypothetical protein
VLDTPKDIVDGGKKTARSYEILQPVEEAVERIPR